MRKIKLLGKTLKEAEIAKLMDLAKTAGCAANEIEVVGAVGVPDEDCDDEIIVVPVSPATCADPDLEKELAKCPSEGRRVICIWPEENAPPELPPAAQKYSYSIIPPDPEKLRITVADDDNMIFETVTGEPLPKVPTERNCCVDDPTKKKSKSAAK